MDAFSSERFSGNPAGVCLLEDWLPEHRMQQIAAENNLSETAFVVASRKNFGIRWFSPKVEVNLCGHATLAAAYVLFQTKRVKGDRVHFESHSGALEVEQRADGLYLDFPSWPPLRAPVPPNLIEALGALPNEVFISRDTIAVFEDPQVVQDLQPDFVAMEKLDTFGIVVTAPGKNEDYVCRCFAPRAGVPEDPVTGSVQCELVPYWAERLGKTTLLARQLSVRGGVMNCELAGDRVRIGGKAALYFQTEITL